MTAQLANSSNNILVANFPVGLLQCNCSIIADPVTKEAAVIDPGGDPQRIISELDKHGLKVKYLLHTHAHFDHILGTKAIAEHTGAKICLHKGDEWLYSNLLVQGAFIGFNLMKEKTLPIDHYLEDEEELCLGDLKAKVIHTPGHTPGSTCFALSQEDQSGLLFAGDTLFRNGIGRTDLWGGSHDDITKSIKNRLFVLEESTQVIAGHGTSTSIWEEKHNNPYVH